MAHIIVVGNEKGGAGKSTVSMHVATALSRLGYGVGVLDLDLRQQTLTRYIANRERYLAQEGMSLPGPISHGLPQYQGKTLELFAPQEEVDPAIRQAVGELDAAMDYILIDCPGSHSHLSQIAHSMADTLITPMNDSFIDFDLLARIDTDGETILGPSVYAEMVWNARTMRAKAGLKPIDWIVIRNRVGSQAMKNKAKVEKALTKLSKRIGFRTGPGFSERVVFRELFPRGLTLLDLKEAGVKQLNISNIAARQELRELLRALDLEGVDVNF